MSDQIIIRGLQFSCRIGVPVEERANPQELRAHLVMDVEPFPKHDRIDGTVDYKAVSDRVRELAGQGERQLIETLAQDIASLILNEFPVSEVRVELEKYILPETDWVGVVIKRTSAKRN
ncbi:MAG: dihydroneopterin aldolase [Akkermansiaceae bacterium]|jgi:dihydroneopterin aldolase|tara:strand:- start:1747 stop:2103 length:357 start_codon:yes stop_codon:yes gene_type:complete